MTDLEMKDIEEIISLNDPELREITLEFCEEARKLLGEIHPSEETIELEHSEFLKITLLFCHKALAILRQKRQPEGLAKLESERTSGELYFELQEMLKKPLGVLHLMPGGMQEMESGSTEDIEDVSNSHPAGKKKQTKKKKQKTSTS